MRPGPALCPRPGWLLVAALASGCSDVPSAAAPSPMPSDPAMPGKVEPAPASELALGRAVLEALRHDDWDGYTNLLATRADMMSLYAHESRAEERERRKRRRMVWRRVNRLRDGEAEDGWKAARREAARAGVAWDAVRLVDVRQEAVEDGDLPPEAKAARLELVLEHQGAQGVLALGTCVRSARGWVVLYPMRWPTSWQAVPGTNVAAPDR